MAILRRNAIHALETIAAHAADPTGTYPLPPGSHIALVTSRNAFAGLEGPWQRLEDLAGETHHVFQSFAWLHRFAHVYNPDLRIVTGYHAGELVFAWPLMRVRVGPLHALRWLSEPHAQYGDVLAARGQCPKAWMTAALTALEGLRGVDIIRLRHVREDAAASPFLTTRFRSSNMDEWAPWLDLSAFESEAAYEARYNANQRKRRKKIRKALEDAFGPVVFEILPDGPERTETIRNAIAEKCLWVDERGRHNRILACPSLPAFIEQAGPELVVSRLTAGGRPISWELGLRFRGTHFCFMTSHVNALTDYSPARLHMDFSQRQALKDGMKAFDLMVPNDAYKDSWCSARVATHDYHLPLTPMGKLYGAGYLENLRPVLREAYHHTSPRLLRLLKPIIGH